MKTIEKKIITQRHSVHFLWWKKFSSSTL